MGETKQKEARDELQGDAGRDAREQTQFQTRPADTQNMASSPIREVDIAGPTLVEKFTNAEEKVSALMEKLE